MGEFSQNLLKLTEFPFSYSLIGLLALIFGQGSGVEELNFAKFGPLLILMGFVATTLSICDPVGAIQRRIISGRDLITDWSDYSDVITHDGIPRFTRPSHDLNQTIFGISILGYFQLHPLHMLSMLYSAKDIKKRYPNFNAPLVFVVAETGKLAEKSTELEGLTIQFDTEKLIKDARSILSDTAKAQKFLDDVFLDFSSIMVGLADLKQNTVRIKWITAEVDRTTALFYFIIVISLFIIAILVSLAYPAFFQHFTLNFPDIVTRLVILILSSMALGGVIYMPRLRIKGLEKKASTVFKYLIALETIKSTKENFKTALQDIERYLNDNEWALAGYWVHRVILEYHELLQEEVHKPIESLEEK